MELQIRPALESDIPAITTIYNDVVLTTTAIYEETLRSKEQMAEWFAKRQQPGLATFVAEADGKVVGWSTYGPFRHTYCSRSTIEHGLHLTPLARGKGYGKSMLEHLIREAKQNRFHAMIGAVDSGNTPSLRLHAKYGFTQVALLPQLARKFDRWLDLALMQLILE